MGRQQQAEAPPAQAFAFYRITDKGKAAAAPDNGELHCRYLLDLLSLFVNSGRSIRECELRQFMPPASLEASINSLLERGLIECAGRPRRS